MIVFSLENKSNIIDPDAHAAALLRAKCIK